MTKEKLLEIEKEVKKNRHNWRYFDPFEINGITISPEEDFGGEGEGDEYWTVIKVEDGEEVTFWQIPGWYSSDYGGELEFGNIFQVKSEKVLIDVWKAVK